MPSDIQTPIHKPVVLLCWGYHRKGWIEPFEQLRDRFSFVYLFNISQAEDEHDFASDRKIYWGDFASPFDILDSLKPDKVVFMGAFSGYAIALNIACRHRAVPTYTLQHGLYQQYSVYRQIELASQQRVPAAPQQPVRAGLPANGQKSGVLAFLLKALRPRDLVQLPGLALYLYLMRKKGKYFAARHVPLALRRTDFYVCYTRRNAALHLELDRPAAGQLRYIGPPEYDRFFDGRPHPSPIPQPYYLLIDLPLAGNRYYDVGITREQVNQFYGKLLVFCQAQNARLAIKLHPECYSETWMLQHPGIHYLREADIVGLVRNARGCFGTFSTLLIPALYFRPCVLFRLFNSTVQAHLLELGVATSLDFYHFEPSDIDFGKVKSLGAESPEFIRDYLYLTDGKATERLGEVLSAGT